MDPVLSPYIGVSNAAAAIEFYANAFGGVERMRLTEPSGRIGHAELSIGDSVLMLADEYPEIGHVGPKALGGTPVALHIRVDDVDAVCERAVAGGATIERPPEDQFHGARSATVIDPFGHRWMVQTVTEELSTEEVERRFAAMFS
jgi:PhnB protein